MSVVGKTGMPGPLLKYPFLVMAHWHSVNVQAAVADNAAEKTGTALRA